MKKVLISKHCIENVDRFYQLFGENGIVFEEVEKDGGVLLDKICKLKPDVLICEAFMPSKDGLSLLKDIGNLSIATKTVLVLPASNMFLENELARNGASYYFIRPFELEDMAQIVGDLLNCTYLNYRTNGRTQSMLEENVSNILHELGIPANIKGYQYLRYAVLLCVNDMDNINHITKGLYPKIAEKFNATPSRVERAMRHSIEIAWQRGDIDLLESYFKNTVDFKKDKPSNSEFIAMITEIIKLKKDKNLSKRKRNLFWA